MKVCPPPPDPGPCPPAGPSGDDVCGRERYNSQRFGGGQPTTTVVRDPNEQCADGMGYVPAPTLITLVPNSIDVEPNHQGLVILRNDGVIVDASSTFYREISVMPR